MTTVAVIGLGYVGLPLALQFGQHFETIGFDINEAKVESYHKGIDPTGEVDASEFQEAIRFRATTNIMEINAADFIIIAMPTPVDSNNVPDFSYLINASALVGRWMKVGATVIYESTVHPGCTEEICVPVLEDASYGRWMETFNVAYSPERICPGDKVMTLTKLKKIVAGDTRTTLEAVSNLYQHIITAGVYEAPSIRVAEAAKVVENIQRDVNIALMNELATIFHKLHLDTNEVIDAAASKWNFANYRPGLVGGHCIGVDPYYLIHKALEVDHVSQFLNQTRNVNNSIPRFIVRETIKDLADPRGMKVAILGLTFKENCKDIRNSKVIDLVRAYQSAGLEVFAYDPIADPAEIKHEYGIDVVSFEDIPQCDIVVLASPHKELLNMEFSKIYSKIHFGGTFVDVKGKIPQVMFSKSSVKHWRL